MPGLLIIVNYRGESFFSASCLVYLSLYKVVHVNLSMVLFLTKANCWQKRGERKKMQGYRVPLPQDCVVSGVNRLLRRGLRKAGL